MRAKSLLLMSAVASLLAACGSGDINLSPSVVDNSISNTPTTPAPTVNPCARYDQSGQTFQGTFTGGNCVYSALFVGDTKPITVDAITFSNFGGLHIFEDSLYIGEDVDRNAAAAGKRIPQEGEGTTLTIEAGSTMVFRAADSYVRIARGSQIVAEGAADAPITFTADEDSAAGGSGATESDRGLWGGIQINGNGRTNKCDDGTATGSGAVGGVGSGANDFAATLNNVHNCHVTAEGRPATYGGNNNAENSGVLQYVVVKYAGFEVVDGNELNAVTLNAVGSGTTISHVQTYTTQDDGFEMFGGAVNLDHIVAVNVGDDSIDFSEGYNGNIQYAVVLHTSGSNQCVEGDNTGTGVVDSVTPTTKLRISNLTCITSARAANSGTNPTSKGASEGPIFREGAFFEMYNSIITTNAPSMTALDCLEVRDTQGPNTIDALQNGTSRASSNVIACSPDTEALLVSSAQGDNAGFDPTELRIWLNGGDGSPLVPVNTNTNNVVQTTNLPANLIVGGTGTRGYLTATALTDSTSAVIFNQATQLFAAGTLGAFFETPTYLGGANASDNWLEGWTVGLDAPLVP